MVNMAGLPGSSVCAGLEAGALALGQPLIGRRFGLRSRFRGASALEQVAGAYTAPQWW